MHRHGGVALVAHVKSPISAVELAESAQKTEWMENQMVLKLTFVDI